jgi:hypothetical protein
MPELLREILKVRFRFEPKFLTNPEDIRGRSCFDQWALTTEDTEVTELCNRNDVSAQHFIPFFDSVFLCGSFLKGGNRGPVTRHVLQVPF